MKTLTTITPCTRGNWKFKYQILRKAIGNPKAKEQAKRNPKAKKPKKSKC